MVVSQPYVAKALWKVHVNHCNHAGNDRTRRVVRCSFHAFSHIPRGDDVVIDDLAFLKVLRKFYGIPDDVIREYIRMCKCSDRQSQSQQQQQAGKKDAKAHSEKPAPKAKAEVI